MSEPAKTAWDLTQELRSLGLGTGALNDMEYKNASKRFDEIKEILQGISLETKPDETPPAVDCKKCALWSSTANRCSAWLTNDGTCETFTQEPIVINDETPPELLPLVDAPKRHCQCKIDPDIIGGWFAKDGRITCSSCRLPRGASS